MDGHEFSQPARDDLPPGSILGGKYRVESKLAEGGMGTVWVATNVVLESRVAIKVLHREHVNSETAEARLLREARAAAQIGHQNIVQVFDFGKTDDGCPFIVMELLQGEDLGDRLDRIGRMPDIEAVKLMIPVVSAVAAAHAKGIVHRDLKPQNIFLAQDASGVEIPKVVDFGVAKVHVLQHTPKLTIEGRVVGSPEYLSPEQARGQEDIDARADIWALGVTLYEMICGELAFADENYNRLLRRIIEDEPASLAMRGMADPELSDIVARSMAKPRGERWQSAAEMGEALVQWLDAQGSVLSPSVRFSHPDPRESTAAVVVTPPAMASARRDAITAPDGASVVADAARNTSSRRHDDRMALTAPDRVRRAASSRTALVVLIAGVLVIGGVVVVGLSLMSAAARRQNALADAATSASAVSPGQDAPPAQAASAILPPAASEPPAPADSTAQELSSTGSTAPSVATAARTSSPRPAEGRPHPVKTAGAKPPPIPTEPNF